MDTLTQPTAPAGAAANDTGRQYDELAPMAQRLITWITIGGLALGTYGTFHAVTTLTFGTSPADLPFNSPTFESIHRLAVITVLASQVLQLVGSAALWRRRLLGRTLLITYAGVYLSGLVLVQAMRGIDAASMAVQPTAGQRAMLALSEMHLLVYGSVFPMFLLAVLTRPWVTRLLRRKGEPLPVVGEVTAGGSGCGAGCSHEKGQGPSEGRRAA